MKFFQVWDWLSCEHADTNIMSSCVQLTYVSRKHCFLAFTYLWPYNVSNTSSMMTVKIKKTGIDIDFPFTAGYSIVGKRVICLLFIYYWAHYFIIIFIDSFIYSLTHLRTGKSTESVDSCRVSTLALPTLSHIWCWRSESHKFYHIFKVNKN